MKILFYQMCSKKLSVTYNRKTASKVYINDKNSHYIL